jgi:hypothetical protein
VGEKSRYRTLSRRELTDMVYSLNERIADNSRYEQDRINTLRDRINKLEYDLNSTNGNRKSTPGELPEVCRG